MKKKETKSRQRFDIKSFLISVLCLMPVAAVLVWSALPSIKSVVAITKFGQLTINRAELVSEETVTTLKRQIQRHFLNYSIYIPTEDIVIISSGENKNTRLESLMTKACGHGSLFVWIPFKISLPFYGEKVIEWCWRPRLQLEK